MVPALLTTSDGERLLIVNNTYISMSSIYSLNNKINSCLLIFNNKYFTFFRVWKPIVCFCLISIIIVYRKNRVHQMVMSAVYPRALCTRPLAGGRARVVCAVRVRRLREASASHIYAHTFTTYCNFNTKRFYHNSWRLNFFLNCILEMLPYLTDALITNSLNMIVRLPKVKIWT